MRITALLSSAAFLGLAACSSVAAGPSSDYDGLDRAQLLDDLQILASDMMQGREAGTPGNALARGYIIERLEGIGVDPVGESFEHPFEYSFRRGPGERLPELVAARCVLPILLPVSCDRRIRPGCPLGLSANA